MTTKQWILLLICGCTIATLVGCGGGSSTTPPPPAISVSFSTAPPASLQVSKTAPVTATVANDSSNAGVDWSCTPANSCGAFNPTHTPSGTATTYTAPASVPSGGKVTITATSSADNTKSASGNTNITVAPIVVTFSPAPPKSLPTNGNANITAIVTGDPQNLGVDWSCAPVNACGSFNTTHTTSGSAVSYTAPNTIPSGGTVTVKASSTADSTKSASAVITITQGNITIFFQPQPPPSVLINSNTFLTAIVLSDPTGAGVDWSCTPVGSCGSFHPPHTASNSSTTYTAPGSPTTVIVTAASHADPTKTVSKQIEIATIFVYFDPAPTPFSLINATSPLTAVVAGDNTNAGVTWSCAPLGSCGSFNPTTTASGQATTYTAPGSAGTVTVTATSNKDNTRQTQATIAIATSFGNAALNGNYVFAASGRDSFAYPKGRPPGAYQVAGVFTADGSGNITGGEQIYSDQPLVATDQISASGSSYSIGSDGRGTITLNTGDTSIGVNGVETFSVALLGGTQGSVTQFDASASSSGTLDLQTSTSANTPLASGYAFVTSGVEFAYTKAPLGIGGVFNIDSPNTISGAGSVVDINDNGTLTTGATLTGNVANPDSFGKAVVNLTLNSGAFLTYVGFTIDDTHVKLIEKDRCTGCTYGTTAGVAYAQGSSTGTFTNASFNTTVVYGNEGFSTVGTSTLLPTAYAGLFTADGIGDITAGYTDENQFGTLIRDTLSGSYLADSTKTGRVTTSGMFYGSSGQGPSWILYLTGATDVPALILQVDGSTMTNPNFIETVGTTYTQTSGQTGLSSFTGPYGMGFSFFPGSGGEDDGTGQVVANGVNTLSPGTEDLNVCTFDTTTNLCSSFTPNPGLALSGTFGTSGVTGRFMGTLTDSTVFNTDPIAFYIADTTRVLFIDIGAQPALGVFRQQQ
jgi:hypothetical protein